MTNFRSSFFFFLQLSTWFPPSFQNEKTAFLAPEMISYWSPNAIKYEQIHFMKTKGVILTCKQEFESFYWQWPFQKQDCTEKKRIRSKHTEWNSWWLRHGKAVYEKDKYIFPYLISGPVRIPSTPTRLQGLLSIFASASTAVVREIHKR